MPRENPKLFYLRDEHGHPVACVASMQTTASGKSVIKFAVSTRNPQDQFDKEVARSLAAGRLFGKDCMYVTDGTGAKQRILAAIANHRNYPQRARDAALLWIAQHSSAASA